MIEYDESAQRLVLKLVYYGPALSGKTTNLLCLHDQLRQDGRGELMMLDTSDDRTIYFDLLPFFYVAPSGLKIKLKVYTVPGQVRHDATRKAVLQRADGVVFVADSSPQAMLQNSESFENLERNLVMVGLSIEQVPLVVQFNKRDLPDAVSEEAIRKAWGSSGLPILMASALQGWGVVETFREIVRLGFVALDRRLCLKQRHGVNGEEFVNALVRVP